MTRTMVPQASGGALRRLRDAVRPGAAEPFEEHLHFDRGARAWLTHGELAERRLVGSRDAAVLWLGGDASPRLQEIA
jgi:hypothetical protein